MKKAIKKQVEEELNEMFEHLEIAWQKPEDINILKLAGNIHRIKEHLGITSTKINKK